MTVYALMQWFCPRHPPLLPLDPQTNKNFVKLCQDCGLFDNRYGTTEADLLFKKFVSNNKVSREWTGGVWDCHFQADLFESKASWT